MFNSTQSVDDPLFCKGNVELGPYISSDDTSSGAGEKEQHASLSATPSPGHNSGERAPFISSEKYFISSQISLRPPGLT